jgi:hypothetical protein
MYHKKFVKKTDKQSKMDAGETLAPDFQFMNVYST